MICQDFENKSSHSIVKNAFVGVTLWHNIKCPVIENKNAELKKTLS